MGLLRKLKRFLFSVIKGLPFAQQAKDLLYAAVKNIKEASSTKVHDGFNLFSIGVLNILNFMAIATGKGYTVLLGSSVVYFLLDLLFIAKHPESVKSPKAILMHHFASAIYMLVPYVYPKYQWCLSACLLVEINTWLQIARRTLPVPFLNELFYISWVGLRLVMYPYLIGVVGNEWVMSGPTVSERDPIMLFATGMQTLLTGLNYYWTYQLLSKMVGGKKRNVRPVCSKDKPVFSHTVHVEARGGAAEEKDKSQ